MKTFIVCVDASAPVEERDGFTKHLRALPDAFWHYIDHMWIVLTKSDDKTPEEIHKGIREFMPNSASIVLEAEVKDYSAFCTEYAHTWLKTYMESPTGRLARVLAERSQQVSQ